LPFKEEMHKEVSAWSPTASKRLQGPSITNLEGFCGTTISIEEGCLPTLTSRAHPNLVPETEFLPIAMGIDEVNTHTLPRAGSIQYSVNADLLVEFMQVTHHVKMPSQYFSLYTQSKRMRDGEREMKGEKENETQHKLILVSGRTMHTRFRLGTSRRFPASVVRFAWQVLPSAQLTPGSFAMTTESSSAACA
jgi:hypothetical protein